MEWYMYALSAVGGAAFGFAVAYVNMLISKANLNKDNFAAIMGANVLRLLVDAAALAAAYFVCKALSFPMIVPLIAVALGLSVGGMFFLKKIAKQIQSQSDDTVNGGE